MNTKTLRADIADEIWRTGKTSDRNRMVLDLLDEHAEMAALLEALTKHWRHPGEVRDDARALLARIRGEA